MPRARVAVLGPVLAALLLALVAAPSHATEETPASTGARPSRRRNRPWRRTPSR